MVDINGYEIKSAFSGGEPVKAIYSLGEKVWPVTGPEPEPATSGWLCFTALEDGKIGMSHYGTNATTTKPNFSYSKDGVNWTVWDYSAILVNTGDVVYFKGINNRISHMGSINELDDRNFSAFYSTHKFSASGNIMSLLYGDYFEGKLIVDDYCFHHLFYNCTGLTTAPELPATTVGFMGYSTMFLNCTSLTTAPELPATKVGSYGYFAMFIGCTSLTTAPELSATTLGEKCCGQMFEGCTSLTTAQKILPATKLVPMCYSHMFKGCTSLTTAPELPATKLATWCYSNMFSGCYKLNYVKAKFNTKPSTDYTENWLSGVSKTGTFVANKNATWTTSITRNESTVPAGWTITK